MRAISNTLETQLETWEDPGDYPSGAGGGPLPSHQYVESVAGTLVVEFTPEELQLQEGEPLNIAIQEFVADNPENFQHEIAGLKVSAWDVDTIEGAVAKLSVRDFEAELPEPDCDDYDD